MVDLREILRSLGVKEAELEAAEEAVDNILLEALKDGVSLKDAAVYFHPDEDELGGEITPYTAIVELFKAERRALRRRMH